MKCPKCGNEFMIQLASNINAKGCRVLTTITSIVTVQCEKCKTVFQVPLNSKRALSVKEKE